MTVLLRYFWALPNTMVGLVVLPLALVRGHARIVEGVLEAHGPVLAAALRRAVPMEGGAAALTLGHIVIGCDAAALDVTRCHERAHVRQCERWGIAFIPAYLVASGWALVTGAGAYDGNYFERQARAEEHREARRRL